METIQQVTRRSAASAVRALDLDTLLALDVAALCELYARGAVPDGVEALSGHPRGRLLAVRALDHGVRASAVRTLAGLAAFPWGGKSFGGSGASGTGVNRVHLFGRHELFPFRTRIQPSVMDGRPCIALDYDLADNPTLIRSIHDEVRRVAPGLFLGPAMWKSATAPRLVLWFALDAHQQAQPVGAAKP